MTKKRGGKRRGAGRKPLDASQKKKPITVWLSPAERSYCEQLGDNAQDGIRQLITEGMKSSQPAEQNHGEGRQIPSCEPQQVSS